MGDNTHPESGLLPSSSKTHPRTASWFESLKRYVQETNVGSLNLSNMKLKPAEVASILEFLADSQVTELDLSQNDLKNQMPSLSKFLTSTKIKKLNVHKCHLKTHDVLSMMHVLKDTKITDLDISDNYFSFSENCGHLFTAHLMESHLTVLNIDNCLREITSEDALSLFRALRETSITHLNLRSALTCNPRLHPDTRLALFFELKHTSITHLSLACCRIGSDLMLGDSLRESNLVELDLHYNHLGDKGVDSILQAVVGSKITSLNLSLNGILGNNNLGALIKDTQIKSLDLSRNYNICKERMFAFPDFLKDSKMESLNLDVCLLRDHIGVPLMKSLKFSKLKQLSIRRSKLKFVSIHALFEVVKDTDLTDFSFSCFDRDDELVGLKLILIGALSIASKIQHLTVCEFRSAMSEPTLVPAFFKTLKNSSVTTVSLTRFGLGKSGSEALAAVLANVSITHLNLQENELKAGVLSLAPSLKFTVITHLNLASNNINDEGANALADCLNETRIIDLDLSCNDITCGGAISLALFLKNKVVFDLKLNGNKIGNQGLDALAEHLKPGLITSLYVTGNPGNVFAVEKAVWANRRLVYKLVSAFKRIAPIDSVLEEVLPGNSDINMFLEEFLNCYKTVGEQSFAANILAREDSTLLTDEIATFLTITFPQKLSSFITSSIEASPIEHVKFLRKVEAMQLDKIVELLLLNRPSYIIDESHSILHPYVYKLLIKYKLPICNLDVERQGIEKIVQYFTGFTNIEGAVESVHLLQTSNVS